MAAALASPHTSASLLLDGNFGMAITPAESGLASRPAAGLHALLDGNIYNAPELAGTLGLHPAAGHAEVALGAFERYGRGALRQFNGDFALAVWDSRKRRLFLGRDRFGSRPLFYVSTPGAFAFASSSRALLGLPGSPRELSPAAVVQTFQLWATLPGTSAFTGIRELPAGHWLELSEGAEPVIGRWWDLDFSESPDSTDPDSLAEELLSLLDDAVRLRSSDTPGAYVSGGLDSSATTALLQRQLREPVRGFAIGFRDAAFDETPQQEQLAGALGIDLERLVISGSDIADAFPAVIRNSERPMLRTAPAPLLRLAQLAADSGIGAVLTGEGADELFGGYAIFKELAVRRFWARQPASKLRPLLFARLNPYLVQDLSRAGSMLGNYYGADLENTGDPLYSHSNRFRNGRRNLRFLLPGALEAAGDPEAELLSLLPERFGEWEALDRAQYLEVRTFLEGYLLPSQGDRMLRAAGVDGRYPFLDHRVAEFAARLPARLRLHGLEEKYLLRRAVSALLPAAIGRREKQPYRAPLLRPFLGDGAPGWVADLLDPENVAASGLFAPERVAGLSAKARKNLDVGVSEMDEMALIGVLSTLLLKETLLDNPDTPPALKDVRVQQLQGGAA